MQSASERAASITLTVPDVAVWVSASHRRGTFPHTHVANLGELFGSLVEVGGGCEFEVLGRPSPELVEATRGLELTAFTPFQGK